MVINFLKGKAPRLQKITAGGGYKKAVVDYVTKEFAWVVEIAQKPESTQGFIPQKNRWQAERSSGWLNRPATRFKRRLFRDVEKNGGDAQSIFRSNA